MKIIRNKIDSLKIKFVDNNEENSLSMFLSVLYKLNVIIKKPGFKSHDFSKEEIIFLNELIGSIIELESEIVEE